jgi:hypothetical protein
MPKNPRLLNLGVNSILIRLRYGTDSSENIPEIMAILP